jgi:phosphatidylinositol alpha-mannosyltransferase
VRVALVSPYSWTYPGGVMRHIEALARELTAQGHEARILAPSDPPDRLAARLHGGHAPAERPVPGHVVPLGRTIGFPANGAISNIAITPYAVTTLRRELALGAYDVVHLHEPITPVVGWDALMSAGIPLVGTFHCYSENAVSNGIGITLGARRRLNRLRVRIAVSEAAAWTGRRFFGGRYTVIPNGVDVAGSPAELLALRPRHEPGDVLRLAFVGQAVERKGLPILLRAFEALREHVAAELTIVGAGPDEVAPLLHDARGVTALGKVGDARKAEVLREADLLVAPSLGGESFGMVLTEAFAAGTPVVASDIAGYRDVVSDGRDGVLVPPGDATALAAALRDLALQPARRAALGERAAASAQRYAWPHVTGEVLEAYERAIAVPVPVTRTRRVLTAAGALPADGLPPVPAVRLPSLRPEVEPAAHPGRRLLRRGALGAAGLAAAAGGVLAVDRIGPRNITEALLASSPPWVLLALGLMCLSMVVRATAWHAILRAALPGVTVRFADALQGTTIGVLMSATLPARLGEPARAMIVARRLGRAREHLPTVVGTLVSQTVLNIVALVILGGAMFATSSYFDDRWQGLVLFALTPIVVLAAVVLAPVLLRRGDDGRASRWLRTARGALAQVRSGLSVFRRPRLGAQATVAQLGAWGIQWLSCYALLVAFGLERQAGIGAAAAVLFAVNVTAVLPATPSNLGVFQAACVAVLSGAYGVSSAEALGYGIMLQAVEIATAFVMGGPALLREGLSWKDVRMRALHAAPVELPPLSQPLVTRPGGPHPPA